jgi:ElaB/YqjD/DUF883 family membrane-anchored ribosome-binding protein
MAERPGELNNVDKLDPISTTAGAGGDQFLDRYSEDLSDSDQREFDAETGEQPEDTEQIKAQIEETRNQMGETIDAIQERLSFANISEQVSETVNSAIETAKDTAYDATIGKAVGFMKNVGDGVTHSGAFRTIKTNPFPLALIGLGTGLLIYQSYNRKGSYRRGYGQGYERRFYNRPDERSGESTFESARGAISDRASSAYTGVTEKASSALEGVSNVAGNAYEKVTGVVDKTYTGAGELANKAYDRVGEFGTVAQEKYDEYLEENPLALGALAVAIGAAVGFAVPSTRYEGKMMGEARETLMHRAQEAAGSLVDKAKHVATEAGETIKEEAQSLTR